MTELTSPLQPVRLWYEMATGDTYWMERNLHELGEALHLSTGPDGEPASVTAELALAERVRQLRQEGYNPDHDLGHELQLTRAGYCYAEAAAAQIMNPAWSSRERDGLYGVLMNAIPQAWPWEHRYWKPDTDPHRNLVKASALLSAAGDAILMARA